MSYTIANEQLYSRSLRTLYFTRTLVQIVWAVVVILTAISNPSLAAALLILYPVWDVACTAWDLRNTSGSTNGSPTVRYANLALGTLAAIGIALTVFQSPQQAVEVFGAWACAAGVAQFVVGLARRKEFGGQWAMILSGVQSTAAGVAFIAGAMHDKTHIKDLGGYAIFGAIYFLIAGVLLHRKLSKAEQGAA